MGYKTILVHCDASKTTASRVRVAADLADRFNAHLIGVHIRQRFEAPMASDGNLAMDSLYRTYENAAKAEEAAAAAAFKGALGSRSPSSEWRVIEGPAEEALAVEARCADLVIVGQREPDPLPMATLPDLAEKFAMITERPMIVVPHIGAAKPPGKTVMLCWNGRREAGRAAGGALPLLKAASNVIVLVIDSGKDRTGHRAAPGTDVAGWLARHGVKVTVQRDTAVDSDVGNVILSRAADHDVDLVVMGIYGHSRMREMVLGGASRTLLATMTVPLLIAH
ncbi:MAG: universal stress protein [Reyranellales bacterium]